MGIHTHTHTHTHSKIRTHDTSDKVHARTWTHIQAAVPSIWPSTACTHIRGGELPRMQAYVHRMATMLTHTHAMHAHTTHVDRVWHTGTQAHTRMHRSTEPPPYMLPWHSHSRKHGAKITNACSHACIHAQHGRRCVYAPDYVRVHIRGGDSATCMLAAHEHVGA